MSSGSTRTTLPAGGRQVAATRAAYFGSGACTGSAIRNWRANSGTPALSSAFARSSGVAGGRASRPPIGQPLAELGSADPLIRITRPYPQSRERLSGKVDAIPGADRLNATGHSSRRMEAVVGTVPWHVNSAIPTGVRRHLAVRELLEGIDGGEGMT